MEEEPGLSQAGETDDDDEKNMTLRRADWAHLKASLSKLHDTRPNLSVWYAVSFATAAAAGASIYPVSVSANLPPWVAPLYVCVTLSCVIVGATMAWLERRYGHEMRQRLRDIEVDVHEIEQSEQV